MGTENLLGFASVEVMSHLDKSSFSRVVEIKLIRVGSQKTKGGKVKKLKNIQQDSNSIKYLFVRMGLSGRECGPLLLLLIMGMIASCLYAYGNDTMVRENNDGTNSSFRSKSRQGMGYKEQGEELVLARRRRVNLL